MPIFPVVVTWKGASFNIKLDTAEPVENFRLQLQTLTGVPCAGQKLMGFPGGVLKASSWTEVALKGDKISFCHVRRQRDSPCPCQRDCNSACSAAFSPSDELRRRLNVIRDIIQPCKIAQSHGQDRARRRHVPPRPPRGLPRGPHQIASQPAPPQLRATRRHEAGLQRQATRLHLFLRIDVFVSRAKVAHLT
jgi:hypothetical protein